MVYKTFKLNSKKITKNSAISVKEYLIDIIPFEKYEGHYSGKVDGLDDTIGIFLIPYIYFPSSSDSQISQFKAIDGYVEVKINESDIESYFYQINDLEEIFKTELTVGKYFETKNYVLQEDKCRFLGISEDRTNIQILINDSPVDVYFRTDVNIRIFKKDDVSKHLKELSKNPEQLIHLEIDRNDFEVKDRFGGFVEDEKCEYWVFAPGEQANKWDEFYENGIMAIGWDIGDLRNFNSKNEINKKLKQAYNDYRNHPNDTACLWDFVHRLKPGDIIYAKRGTNEIIGRGCVESDYIYDEDREEYKHIRKVTWTDKGSWFYRYKNEKLPQKTLTNITNISYNPRKLRTIKGFFDEDICGKCTKKESDRYTKEEFLNEAYINPEEYDIIVKLLDNKKNLILQGAPGVGKTFISKRLAYSRIGAKCDDRVMMVQFHQSYSYEDFVEGYRPVDDGFKLQKGSFYNFCMKARDNPEKDYYFIIDEINRGNLSKIFGELFMLIENDKRGEKVQLLYSDEEFYIPENLYIIGLMNTADRSLAMIDYALRRRFAFFDLKPGFSSTGFSNYKDGIHNSHFDQVINVMEYLNAYIADDESLGEGFRIGHSFFCNLKEKDVEEQLNYIIEYEIIPLINEYWFDEPDKVRDWSAKLRDSLKE